MERIKWLIMVAEAEMKKKKKTVLDAKNFEEKKKLQKELLQEN